MPVGLVPPGADQRNQLTGIHEREDASGFSSAGAEFERRVVQRSENEIATLRETVSSLAQQAEKTADTVAQLALALQGLPQQLNTTNSAIAQLAEQQNAASRDSSALRSSLTAFTAAAAPAGAAMGEVTIAQASIEAMVIAPTAALTLTSTSETSLTKALAKHSKLIVLRRKATTAASELEQQCAETASDPKVPLPKEHPLSHISVKIHGYNGKWITDGAKDNEKRIELQDNMDTLVRQFQHAALPLVQQWKTYAASKILEDINGVRVDLQSKLTTFFADDVTAGNVASNAATAEIEEVLKRFDVTLAQKAKESAAKQKKEKLDREANESALLQEELKSLQNTDQETIAAALDEKGKEILAITLAAVHAAGGTAPMDDTAPAPPPSVDKLRQRRNQHDDLTKSTPKASKAKDSLNSGATHPAQAGGGRKNQSKKKPENSNKNKKKKKRSGKGN